MLFKETEEVLEFTGVVTSVKITDVTGTINFIEEKILQKYLGPDLYKELSEAYNQTENNMTDEQKELLTYCRRVIGPYICYYYFPKAAIQLGSAGAQRAEGTNTKTSFAYQDKEFRAQYLLEGEAACETLLEYLYKNKISFDSWTNSQAFKQYQELFIKSGTEFNDFYPSAQPFRNYWAMRFKMVDIELMAIEKAITSPLYEYLKEKEKEDGHEWSNEEEKLLFYLKKAIAYFTVATAAPHVNARIDGNGITINSDASGGVNDQEKRKAADNKALSWLVDSCNASGNDWLTKAKQYIVDNATAFEAWQAPEKKAQVKTNNDCLNGSYGLI